MQVLTRQEEELLKRLVRLAGDPLVLQEALRELQSSSDETPSLEEVVRKILEVRNRPSEHATPAR